MAPGKLIRIDTVRLNWRCCGGWETEQDRAVESGERDGLLGSMSKTVSGQM